MMVVLRACSKSFTLYFCFFFVIFTVLSLEVYYTPSLKTTKIPIYFANPYSSWERGLNEHTNGLIRQYLPKKTNFNNVSKKEIEIIEKRLNTRPRKVLDYRTPKEVMFKTETYSLVALRM